MLCTLAVRLTAEGGFLLRVSGTTAVGPSGRCGRDGKEYATLDRLYTELHAFGLDPGGAVAIARELTNPEARKRFLNFAEDVQIPFEKLERADIYLFDGVE